MNLIPNFQKERLERISEFRGNLLGKRGVTLFRGGLLFLHKYVVNKKKVVNKNLFTLKRWDRVKDEKF